MAKFTSTLGTSVLNNLYGSHSAPSLSFFHHERIHRTSRSMFFINPYEKCATKEKDDIIDSKQSSFIATAPVAITSCVHAETAIYNVRWYVLIVFSCYAALQYCIWNTFGPISSSVKKAFDWSNGEIATLANWDTTLFILLSLQICWLVQQQGLRISFLCSVFLVTTGSILKCMTTESNIARWLMNSGQIFNALGGMLAQAAGPFISNTWFPPNERTTATAIASLSSPLGVAISYILGPLMVPDLPITKNANVTSSNITQMKDGIQHLMYLECGVTCSLFIVALIYFPNKPLHPPSLSAAMPKIKFFDGFKRLLRNKDFWLILFVAASITGVYSGWSAILTLNFQDHGLNVTQIDCGWIGFSSTMVSVTAGIFVGFIADKHPGHIRTLLILLYAAASIAFLWLTLICNKLISFNIASIYTACIIGGFCINGSIPLLYELTIECTYPIPETVSIGALSLVNNVFTFVFLLLLNVPSIGVSWMNWLLLAICVTCTILLTLLRENYKRSSIDSHMTDDVTTNIHALDTLI